MYPSDCSSLLSKDLVVIFFSLIVCLLVVNSLVYPTLPNVKQHYAVTCPSSNSRESNYSFHHDTLCPRDEESLTLLDGHIESSLLGDVHEESRVIYRNASWKAEIGIWLSLHGDIAPKSSVSEYIVSKKCDDNCNGRGVCNHHLAECRCFHGYNGKRCELEEEFPCRTSEIMYWRVSWCGATCDKTKAFCYCGEGTKYPQRPVVQGCGFTSNEDGLMDWNKPDSLIFSNKSGWCNLDPHNMPKPLKLGCSCHYDGTGGGLCNEHVESVCINQCSGNGQCRGGFCNCAEGWYGIDCSIPSSLQSLSLDGWPNWLMDLEINTTLFDSSTGEALQELVVAKPRPLIYVYDLPPEFNSHLLEGRHWRFWCSTRSYNYENKTKWILDLYGSEPTLLESFLASPHRTTNAEEADFFFVPTFEACARSQADSAPHTDMQHKYLGLRGYYAGDFHKRAYEHIKEAYPYWNLSSGKDHIWLFPWDEGACSAPKEIWSSIMLVHWGNTQSKYNYSTSSYKADNWSDIPTEWRGSHPCYDPSKDIVIPAWKTPEPDIVKKKLWTRPQEQRPTLFYFRGNLGYLYRHGRPEKEYSMGLRQKLAEEFGSLPNINGQIGRQWAPDVKVMHGSARNYGLELSRSRFCGVFPGDGWSSRMEDSMLHGCIPVIVQDGINLPFEDVLDYNAFTIRIAEEDLGNMIHILKGINESRIDSMLSVVQEMWQRFTYHSAVKLEAQRQEIANKDEASWATEFNKLTEDDAFATLIQEHCTLCTSALYDWCNAWGITIYSRPDKFHIDSHRDIGSKSGSSLKPDVNDPKVPKFGPSQPRVLDKKVPHLLQNGDVILIGKVHHQYGHEIRVTIHRPQGNLKDGQDGPLSLGGKDVVTRKLTWRRSLHCNGCMGWGRRHSCSARLSQLQKMILECNSKSNVTAPRPIKTAIQKVLFHRVSGWWPKKPEKFVTFKVPKRYESDIPQIVGGLPDNLVLFNKRSGEESDNDELTNGDQLEDTFYEPSSEQNDDHLQMNEDDLV